MATRRKHRRSSHRGASMAEAALCFVLFFTISFFVIDWGLIYVKRIMLHLALARAARAGAVATSSCTAAAISTLNIERSRFGNFLPPPATISGVKVDPDPLTVPLNRYRFSTSVQMPCMTCPLIFGTSGQITYTMQAVYPFQDQTSACARTAGGSTP
jgi:hypothetical protein